MAFSRPYYIRSDHTQHAGENYLRLTAPFSPPPGQIHRQYNPDFYYDFPAPAAVDSYRLLEAPANVDSMDVGVNFHQSHWAPEYYAINRPIPRSWSSSTNHYSIASAAAGITTAQNTSIFESDFLLEDPTFGFPSIFKQDLVNNAAATSWSDLWPSMETQAPFESQSAIMWPDWSNPNAPQSPVDSGTVHDNHQNQYSPTENGPSTWWSDGYLVPLSSSSVPLTSDNPQPDVLLDEEASTEPVRGERRKVGTLAIVQASRRRRGINPKSGEMRSSRFYCPEYECDREFTTKQNYDDHLRRHAGKKPFECTVCQKASFTNRSDLNRHQTSEKCEKSAALLTTTK